MYVNCFSVKLGRYLKSTRESTEPRKITGVYVSVDSGLIEKILTFIEFFIVVYSLSHVWSFATPWTVAHQALLSMGFPKQEYWSGLPFPSLGDLPDPGIKLVSPVLAAAFFTAEPPGKPMCWIRVNKTGFMQYRICHLFPGFITLDWSSLFSEP